MLSLSTRFKWKHMGGRRNIGKISSEFLCGPRCLLLVRCQNTWFLLVYCQIIFTLSRDPVPLKRRFYVLYCYWHCSILILNPNVISCCSYLGEVTGFLAESVVSTTGGTVFSSSYLLFLFLPRGSGWLPGRVCGVHHWRYSILILIYTLTVPTLGKWLAS